MYGDPVYVSPEGGPSITVILIVAVVEPLALLAVMIWSVAICVAVGVPLMAHVVVSSTIPAGNAGDAEQFSTVPVTAGVKGVTDVFRVKVYGDPVYVRLDGAAPGSVPVRFTAMEIVAVVLPLELDAVMV